MSDSRKNARPRIRWDPAAVVTLFAAWLVLVTILSVLVSVFLPGSVPLAARIIELCGFRLNDGMEMGPPAGGDAAGMAIVVVGGVLTLIAFVLAIRATMSPGERHEAHPKNLILKEDR
jgi:hypothetical protein